MLTGLSMVDGRAVFLLPSLPLRECGLKFFKVLEHGHAGDRRSPCGSVD